MARLLADTNLLLRLSDSGAALHPTAAHALAALFAREDEVFITAQNLVEFWAVATRPRESNGFGWDTQMTQREIADIRARFPLLPDTPEILDFWLRIVTSSSVSGKRTHDARLAAVMQVHSICNLLTFNTADFAGFPGITAVDPRTLARGAERAQE